MGPLYEPLGLSGGVYGPLEVHMGFGDVEFEVLGFRGFRS